MVAHTRQLVTVEAGGVIRVTVPDLREGTVAEVTVRAERAAAAPPVEEEPGSTWRSFVGAGTHTNRTVEEIDAAIRELRDEWDR